MIFRSDFPFFFLDLKDVFFKLKKNINPNERILFSWSTLFLYFILRDVSLQFPIYSDYALIFHLDSLFYQVGCRQI